MKGTNTVLVHNTCTYTQGKLLKRCVCVCVVCAETILQH